MLPLLDATYIEKQLLFARRRSQTNCFFFSIALTFQFRIGVFNFTQETQFFASVVVDVVCWNLSLQKHSKKLLSTSFFLSPSTSDSKKSHFSSCLSQNTNKRITKNVLLQIVFLRVSSIISQKNWNSKFMA